MRPIQNCMHPNCGRTTRCRGLCDVHYQVAHDLVKKGKTTWEELESKGKCNKKQVNRIRKTWFLEP